MGQASAHFVAVGAGRFHQRKQLVDGLHCDLAHFACVERSGNPHLPDDRVNLIAKVGEESKRVFGIVRNSGNETGNQDLTGDHPAVQFLHDIPPIAIMAQPYRAIAGMERNLFGMMAGDTCLPGCASG
jgi:hypothetical protein